MPTQPNRFHKEQLPAPGLPLWKEAYMGLDWVALRAAPVYYGIGVPRGDGSAVVLVPGFLATDFYLQEMYFWLGRIGYHARLSQIGRNADCINVLVNRLTETVRKAYAQTGRKVHLIGHSLGGVLARSVAVLHPELVASVITMASPFRGIRSHPFVLQMGNFVRERVSQSKGRSPACFSGTCNCAALDALVQGFPASVPQSAIYTKSDGIVDWHACISPDPRNNFEVLGTHGGLAFNPLVYRNIAKLLKERKAA